IPRSFPVAPSRRLAGPQSLQCQRSGRHIPTACVFAAFDEAAESPAPHPKRAARRVVHSRARPRSKRDGTAGIEIRAPGLSATELRAIGLDHEKERGPVALGELETAA